jgi:hypothetical protein
MGYIGLWLAPQVLLSFRKQYVYNEQQLSLSVGILDTGQLARFINPLIATRCHCSLAVKDSSCLLESINYSSLV